MSGEDFIFSAITDDNVNAFDLNIIANTLASTDKLVRQNKQQREENESLREKISSLRESALQIKNLYEAELAKTSRVEAQLATYVSQCKELEQRCVLAENEQVNTDLLLKERIAEYDRQMETTDARYRGLVCDLARFCSADQHHSQGAQNNDAIVKWKDIRVHAATTEKLDLPEDVKAFFHHTHPPGHSTSRTKRKKRVDMRDQECQTVDDTRAQRLRHSGTNTEEPYPVLKEPPVEKKTFCDKGTMHSTMSTITRSTCTSAFIKRVDVGLNFPEVTHKSVDEILRECTRLPPLLLSPITDMVPRSQRFCSPQSVETQTDFCQSPELHLSCLATVTDKPQSVSCGTMTSLKNIRKRIDYRKADTGVTVGVSSFQQQYISMAEQLYAKKIKKEEQMATSPLGFGPDDTFGRMHPHLSTIWTLLGETIFSLMGSPGRRFDGQCYSVINQQLATIRDMIEADGRRESELMSAMFSNVSATVEAAAGYGKERSDGFPLRFPTTPPEHEPTEPSRCPTSCFPSDLTPTAGFVERCQVPSSNDRCRDEPDKEQRAPPENGTIDYPSTPLSISCPTQTKEIDRPLDASIANHTASPQVQQHPDTNAHIAEKTETDARSIHTLDDSIAVVVPNTLVTVEEPESSSTIIANDDENDRIAQALRLMEEGAEEMPHQPVDGAYMTDGEKLGLTSVEAILAPVPVKRTAGELRGPAIERIANSPCLAAENFTPPERPSTPPKSLEPSTATFVSPIKVKETNDLVKDQFKTPAQPPISKRKLRIRHSSEAPSSSSPKRQRLSEANIVGSSVPPSDHTGRLSPTTEFLLEDDWDRKFSTIKAAMLPAIDGTYRPLSPIIDQIEPDDDAEVRSDVNTNVSETQEAGCRVEKKMEENVSKEQGDDALVAGEMITTVRALTRIEKCASSDSEAIGGSVKIDHVAMELDSELNYSHNRENALITVCSAASIATVNTDGLPSESSGKETVTLDSDPKDADESAHDKKHEANVSSTFMEVTVVETQEDGEIADNDGEGSVGLNTATEKVRSDAVELESPESPIWDSPMSPPAHETGTNITSESVFNLDSPLSPPPPASGEVDSFEPPRLIPLDHVNLYQHRQRKRGPIDLAIDCYVLQRRFEVINAHVGRLSAQEMRASQQLAEVLQRYIKSPWTDAAVAEALVKVLAISQDGRGIACAVLEAVVSHGDIVINLECSPPAPPIPVTQQKLVLLVRHLAPRLTNEPFDRVMMRELDRRVFQLKSEATVPLPGLIALTFLYIGLEDSKPPTVVPWHRTYSVRLYLFKCLYYFGYKCLPLVYYVLRAFPFALPKKGSPNYDNADAMISTIRTILMNINYSEGGNVAGPDAALYKKRELVGLLTYQYGYQLGSPTYEELVVNLVEKIRANRLRNVPNALILVAKRKCYEWARQHIIQKRLYPLLNDYLKLLDLMSGGAPGGTSSTTTAAAAGCDLVGLDERIVACIYTISSIMKTHPANEDVSGVMQIFTTIVQLARGHQAIQEEAIAGLVKFSRFGHADIFERITHWQPTYPVSDRIKLMLATLLHRKDLRFWKQLIQNKIV